MIKVILIIVLIFWTNFNFYAQSVYKYDPETKIVSNWEAKYKFNYFFNYDFDLNLAGKSVYAPSILAIEISGGTGRLISFVNEKVIFQITKCKVFSDSFVFTLKNQNGAEFRGTLWLNEDNSINKFVYRNPASGTGFVLY